MNEQQPQPREDAEIELPDFNEDRLLRREAGEGWKFDEPDPRLFGFLIARETIIETMTQAGLHPPAKDEQNPDELAPIYDAYRAVVQQIDELKKRIGYNGPASSST